MNNRKLWIALIVLLFLAGAVGSYFFMRNFAKTEKQPPSTTAQSPDIESEDISVLRIYQPLNNGLEMTERKIPKRITNIVLLRLLSKSSLNHSVKWSFSHTAKRQIARPL